MFLPFMPESYYKRIAEFRKREGERRVPLCVDWRPDIKWVKELNIRASTYPIVRLFDVKPIESVLGWMKATTTTTKEFQEGKRKMPNAVLSPGEEFAYCELLMKRGVLIDTAYGRQKGTAVFDEDNAIPILNKRREWGDDPRPWDINPWMSLTPFETMTLRPGTKRAKGSVIVAGLGLGHQLIEVSKRRQVKKLVLVEKSRELVDWLLPRIKPHLQRELDDVVVDDAYQVMPKMSADVALVDIFPSYGGNGWERDRLRQNCPNIKFIWAWGTQFAE